AAGQDFMRF
uniref:FMRFamide-8 n=1 Tax=Lucilia cuprina TaxID=7375 RepID=FAR8_LUCCU|nr:RecName: Full=FMRFamide-8; AltName: Full=LucFMRFamide-8 [Lucilia cuprina]